MSRLTGLQRATDFHPGQLEITPDGVPMPAKPKGWKRPDNMPAQVGELMAGTTPPAPSASNKHYRLFSTEVHGLEIDFRGHHGFVRVGIAADYEDREKLDPLYSARMARLVKCREDFQRFQEDYSKGPEARAVLDLRTRLDLAKQKESEARRKQGEAKGKLHSAILDDLPAELHQEEHQKATHQVFCAQVQRSFLENKLAQAEKAYEESWKVKRDAWVQEQALASKQKADALEAELIAELGQKAALLETERAVTAEMSSSFYSYPSAPELPSDTSSSIPSPPPVNHAQ